MKRLKRYKSSLVFLAAAASIAVALLTDPAVKPATGSRPQKETRATGTSRVGAFARVSGPVVVRPAAGGPCRMARKRGRVLKGEIVQTLAGSRCRLNIMGREAVYLSPDTVFQVDEFHLDKSRSKRHSLFSLYRGSAVFYLPMMAEYSNARAAVRTPSSIVMARGTKFALSVIREEAAQPGIKPPVRVLATCLSGHLWVRHRTSGKETDVPEGFTSVSDAAGIMDAAPSEPGYLRGLLRSSLGVKPLGSSSTSVIVARMK